MAKKVELGGYDAFFSLCTRSVSYTHLDVYKRQTINSTTPFLFYFDSFNQIFFTI